MRIKHVTSCLFVTYLLVHLFIYRRGARVNWRWHAHARTRSVSILLQIEITVNIFIKRPRAV